MESYLQTMLLVILIIFAIIYLYSYNIIESFETYSYGSDPLTFYKYPIYRNPYMYPYKYYSSYPYPYMSYNQTNI